MFRSSLESRFWINYQLLLLPTTSNTTFSPPSLSLLSLHIQSRPVNFSPPSLFPSSLPSIFPSSLPSLFQSSLPSSSSIFFPFHVYIPSPYFIPPPSPPSIDDTKFFPFIEISVKTYFNILKQKNVQSIILSLFQKKIHLHFASSKSRYINVSNPKTRFSSNLKN